MTPQNKSKTFCRTNRSETNINRYGVSEVRQNEGLARARQRSQWASARPRYDETPRNALSNLQRATRAAKTPQLDASTWSEIRRRLGEVICMRRRRRRAEENGDDDRRWTQEQTSNKMWRDDVTHKDAKKFSPSERDSRRESLPRTSHGQANPFHLVKSCLA